MMGSCARLLYKRRPAGSIRQRPRWINPTRRRPWAPDRQPDGRGRLPRHAGAVAPSPEDRRPPVPPRSPHARPPTRPLPGPGLPLRPLPPRPVHLHFQLAPRRQAAGRRAGPDPPRVRPGRADALTALRAGVQPLGVAQASAPGSGRGVAGPRPGAEGRYGAGVRRGVSGRGRGGRAERRPLRPSAAAGQQGPRSELPHEWRAPS
jgi:hypothetical protein